MGMGMGARFAPGLSSDAHGPPLSSPFLSQLVPLSTSGLLEQLMKDAGNKVGKIDSILNQGGFKWA